MISPAVQLFAARLEDRAAFGQLDIRRNEQGFTLRHAADAPTPERELRIVPSADLRNMALFTAQGRFRPLRTAPDLQAGWVCVLANLTELERALNDIYPGALADWHAVQTGFARPMPFRVFAQRQSGMYATLQKLSDEEAARALAACCASAACLKQRRWGLSEVAEIDPNPQAIPCLEPCAILMEFARLHESWLRQRRITLEVLPAEAQTLAAALEKLVAETQERQAQFADPLNVRRLLMSLESPVFKSKHLKSKITSREDEQ